MKFWCCAEIRALQNVDYRGYALLIDWDKKEVINKFVPPAVFNEDINDDTSGYSSRGVRHMVHIENEIYVLVQGGLFVLDDTTLEIKRKISNKYIGAGGHYLLYHDNLLWMNVPAFDWIVCMTLEGEVKNVITLTGNNIVPGTRLMRWENNLPVYKSRESWITRQRELRQIDQLHINTLQFHNGYLYVFSATRKCLIRAYPGEPKVIRNFQAKDSPHDVIFHAGKILMNDSGDSRVNIYNENLMLEGSVNIPILVETKHEKLKSGFVRGMLPMSEDRVIVGTSPLALYEISLSEKRIISSMVLSDDPAHTCHGITIA